MKSNREFSEIELKQIIDYYLAPHSLKDTVKAMGISSVTVLRRILRENNIALHDKNISRQLAQEHAVLTWLDKYGVENPSQSQEVLAKRKETNLARYGVDTFMQSSEFREKAKQTMQQKYGVDYTLQSEELKSKIKMTNLNKYGYTNPQQNLQVQDKTKQTNLERYGVEYLAQNKEISNKQQETYKKHMQSLFGVDHHFQLESIQQKVYQTKMINHTWSSSEPEEEFYQYLLTKYNKTDIKRQYKDTRYPFMCDFYIKSLDLFIELNLSWTHGGHLFDANNSKDTEKLSLWQAKAETSDYYKNAIETWVVRDKRKYQCAQDYNLNYVMIYSKQELYYIIEQKLI